MGADWFFPDYWMMAEAVSSGVARPFNANFWDLFPHCIVSTLGAAFVPL
jgi:hypothetical protein